MEKSSKESPTLASSVPSSDTVQVFTYKPSVQSHVEPPLSAQTIAPSNQSLHSSQPSLTAQLLTSTAVSGAPSANEKKSQTVITKPLRSADMGEDLHDGGNQQVQASLPPVGVHDGNMEDIQVGVTSVGVLDIENQHVQADVAQPKSSTGKIICFAAPLSPMKTVASSTQTQNKGDSSNVVPTWICDSPDSVMPQGTNRAAAGPSQQSTIGSLSQMRLL